MVTGVSINCQGPNTVSRQAISVKRNFSTTSSVGGSTHVRLVPVFGG